MNDVSEKEYEVIWQIRSSDAGRISGMVDA